MSTNMELITSVTVGSGGAASVTLPATGTIPQTYTDLKIIYSARSTSSTSNVIDISFNGNTSSFTNKYLLGSGSSPSSGSNFSRFSGLQNSSVDTANTFANGEIYIPNYTNTSINKSYSSDGVQEINSSTGNNLALIAGLWSNTAAITTITINGYDGNFVEGSTFYLYGISNVTSTTKATGGIVSSDGTYNYHMFPYSGTFTPTTAISADVLVIAGGGSGGAPDNIYGGGGGAGGLLFHSSQSLTATGYSVTVGAGGAGSSFAGTNGGNNGSNSQFGSLTASVGGGGGQNVTNTPGSNGGSGGGGGRTSQNGGSPTSGQGNSGGNGAVAGGGAGGGGAGGAGGISTTSPYNGGPGGIGVNTYSSWAIATQTGDQGYYAGGGGGNGANDILVPGGLGGGGFGSGWSAINNLATSGKANTGGGGGGVVGGSNAHQGASGSGGSGLVIIRYAI